MVLLYVSNFKATKRYSRKTFWFGHNKKVAFGLRWTQVRIFLGPAHYTSMAETSAITKTHLTGSNISESCRIRLLITLVQLCISGPLKVSEVTWRNHDINILFPLSFDLIEIGTWDRHQCGCFGQVPVRFVVILCTQKVQKSVPSAQSIRLWCAGGRTANDTIRATAWFHTAPNTPSPCMPYYAAWCRRSRTVCRGSNDTLF